MRPLQVYLDSNDFSRFGQVLEGRGNPDHRELLGQLVTLGKSGAVQYRLSYIHVTEAAATSEAHVERAVARAQAMQLLCGPNCLEPYFSLPAQEACALLSPDAASPPRERKRFHGRNEAGRWFPSFLNDFREMSEMAQAAISNPLVAAFGEQAASVANREWRRKAKRKSGGMKAIIRRDLPSVFPAFAARMREQFPMSANTERTWQRMIRSPNTLTSTEAAAAMERDLADVPGVMPWLSRHSSGLSGLPEWLRGSGENWSKLVKEFQIERDELIHRTGQPTREAWDRISDGLNDRVADRLMEHALQELEKEKRAIASYGMSAEEATEAARAAGLDAFPSRKTMANLLWANMVKNLSPFEMPRKAEKAASDVGDMAHGWYLPYVDVMRVDGFAFQYMKPGAEEYGTTLVPRLEDLPAAIERMFSTRAT